MGDASLSTMSIPVAVITEAGGAHLDSYFAALAASIDAESVVLVDPSGSSERLARKTLGDKLRKVYRDRDALIGHFTSAIICVSTLRLACLCVQGDPTWSLMTLPTPSSARP